MLILAVDTSSRTGSLAALRGGEILAAVSSNGGSGEPYSSLLFRDLERLLGESHLSLREFELFAVAAGPGSFTGLRVGLTSVKAWAELYNRPVAAVSGLEAIAAQAHAAEGQLIASVLDARRGQIYGGLYRAVREPAMARGSANDGADEAILQLEGDEVVMEAKPFVEMALERAGGGSSGFGHAGFPAMQLLRSESVR
jgi:tRNA threonylcarbamoyl adenosine modification protein YeaZ